MPSGRTFLRTKVRCSASNAYLFRLPRGVSITTRTWPSSSSDVKQIGFASPSFCATMHLSRDCPESCGSQFSFDASLFAEDGASSAYSGASAAIWWTPPDQQGGDHRDARCPAQIRPRSGMEAGPVRTKPQAARQCPGGNGGPGSSVCQPAG